MRLGIEVDAKSPGPLADGLAQVGARGSPSSGGSPASAASASFSTAIAAEGMSGCRSQVDHVAALAPELALQLVDRRKDVREGDRGFAETCISLEEYDRAGEVLAAVSARRVSGSAKVSAPAASAARPGHDWDALARTVTREPIDSGRLAWRYADLLPPCRPRRAGARSRPLVPAPRLALAPARRALPSSTSPTRRTRQGPRRRRRRGEGRGVRARHALGRLDRQPGERRRRPCGRAGKRAIIFCPAGRGREGRATTIYGATIYASTAATTTAAARQRARGRGRLGHRQRQPALLLRRGLEDARLRDRRAARLGDARRGRDADRLRSDVTKVWPGFDQFRRLDLSKGTEPKLFGGQAEGCAPVATAFEEVRPVTPVRRSPRSVDRDRQPGRRRPRRRRRRAAAASTRCPGSGRREHRLPGRDGRHLRRRRDRRGRRCSARGGRRWPARGGGQVVLLVTGTAEDPKLADAAAR